MTTRPKIELHLHHEGAAPPEFIRRLAGEKKIDLSAIFREDGGYAYRNFEHFLEVYEAACTVLQTPEDFGRLTTAILEKTASHGVIYAETFVSPQFCGGGDLAAWKEYLAAIREASERAERDHGITLRTIATCIRHLGPEVARATAHCAVETAGDFLTGFGMGGAEMAGRPGDFAWSFDAAREAGLRLTCHAGEWGGATMVAETLRDLKVERLGHGFGAIEDPALVERIVEDGVVLEVCPGSNVFLKAVESWQAHPLPRLMEKGVKCTVSTDDPPFFHTTMTNEYEMLARVFDFGDAEFALLERTALEAAFCDDATRERIGKRLAD